MSWLERFLNGKFRDAPFKLEAHDAVQTRQIVTHSFPGSESHYSQDMGREPNSFQVSAYIVGKDYDLDRDNLMKACSEPGPGELVHPYLGIRQVHVKSLTLRESKAELRVAKLEIVFVEAGENFFPGPEDGKRPAALAAAAGAREEATDSLERGLSVEAGIAAIRSAAAYIDAQTARIRALEREVGQIYDLDAALTVAVQSAGELLAAPKNLARSFTDAMGRLTGKAGNLYAVEALRRLYQEYAGKVAASSAGEATLDRAIAFHLQKETVLTRSEALAGILGLSGSTLLVPESDYRAALRTVISDIDTLLQRLGEYTEYQVFSDLKSVLLSLSGSADVYALPDLKTWMVPYDMPLSIAAFMIFGSTDRLAELQKINETMDPLLVLKGTELRYLDG
jgi:prophage DNA circulation protein